MPALPPLDSSIARAVSGLFDSERPPSHSEIDTLVARCGLTEIDPKTPGQTIGKRKRVHQLLLDATHANEKSGQRLVYELIEAVAGVGGFRQDGAVFVGVEAHRNAREAFRRCGWSLSDDGRLTAGTSPSDSAPRSGRIELESAVRRILSDSGDVISPDMPFAGNLLYAFQRLNFQIPSGQKATSLTGQLSAIPQERIQQLLYLLILEVHSAAGDVSPSNRASKDLQAIASTLSALLSSSLK